MNSLQIELFLDVAERNSFSKVARERYISQPTISKHIKNLENELNVQLFVRNYTSVELTPAGKIYQKIFNDLREALKNAKMEHDKFADFTGLMRVGFLSGWNIDEKLNNAIKTIQDKYPNIDLQIENHNFKDIIKGLGDGSLDACIHLHDFLSKIDNLTRVPLIEISKFLIYSNTLKKHDNSSPYMQDFAESTFFVIGNHDNGIVKERMESYCNAYSISPKFVMVPNIESVLNNVNMGKGVSIIDSYTGIMNYPHINKLEIYPSHKIEIAWNKNSQNKLIKIIADELAMTLV